MTDTISVDLVQALKKLKLGKLAHALPERAMVSELDVRPTNP